MRSASDYGTTGSMKLGDFLQDHERATRERFAKKAEHAMKLNRAVGHEIADGVVKVVKEETGKHLLPPPERDEITGRQWRYFVTNTVVPRLVKHGVLLKILGGLAAAAGAAWAWFSHVASRIHR